MRTRSAARSRTAQWPEGPGTVEQLPGAAGAAALGAVVEVEGGEGAVVAAAGEWMPACGWMYT